MLNVVIRFSALGDLVLTSAFVKELRDSVIYVSSEQFKPFLEEYLPNPNLKVYGVHKPKLGLIGWFKEGYSFAKFLTQYLKTADEKQVFIYDLHNVGKSTFFSWGLRIGLKENAPSLTCVFKKTKKYRLKRWLQLVFKIEDYDLKALPVYKRHLELLDESSKSTPELNSIDKKVKFLTGNRQLRILIAPDAQHHKKLWPTEYWNELLAKLSEINSITIHLKVVSQNKKLHDIQKYFDQSHHTLEDLQGKTALLDLPGLASDSDLTICSNSAWLHISEAVGTPVLALAGPIVEEFGFSPWMKKSKELSVNLKCRPCTLHGDGICYNLKQFECMRRIKAQDLYAQIWLSLGYRSAPE